MYTIYQLPEFDAWLSGIKDGMTRRRLGRRLEKAQRAAWATSSRWARACGRCANFLGPGWRMYYVQRGAVLIVMLGGGDKSTQAADIAKAIALAGTLED
ncbi:type II toxin-antitoxin system RelE/ParE family toxin [Thauera sp.]|uniref:type II toxin-antitoxin system RelE/ParE family toxin n=1 Tax=Thauera sp. TaxID=1905334 RepID=UPI002A362777|nr:type II toxin-antitoxin system RelE/ParE family toxin [Thauera sp.]MDX9885917.1 type II toxin-antitoxin system RelE/ParE family toxin [Thauera sp.]